MQYICNVWCNVLVFRKYVLICWMQFWPLFIDNSKNLQQLIKNEWSVKAKWIKMLEVLWIWSILKCSVRLFVFIVGHNTYIAVLCTIPFQYKWIAKKDSFEVKMKIHYSLDRRIWWAQTFLAQLECKSWDVLNSIGSVYSVLRNFISRFLFRFETESFFGIRIEIRASLFVFITF